MQIELDPPFTVIIPGVSEEEFFARCDGDSPWELIEGELVMHSPASHPHEQLQQFLLSILSNFVTHRGLGEVLGSRYPVHVGPRSLPEPDIIFVAKRHRRRMTHQCVEGPADFIIEIASPSSLKMDLTTKRRLYLDAGVCEYWVVDPDARVLHRFTASAPDGSEHRTGRIEPAPIQGFWLDVAWLWQNPLPPTFATAARILGVALPPA